MPDFEATQYEAREGRDNYFVRPRRSGKFEVFRVSRGEEQVQIGVVDDLAAANALKDQDQGERTSAPALYALRETGAGRWRLRSYSLIKVGQEPEKDTQRFDTKADALAAIPGAVLLRVLGDGAEEVYSSAPAQVNPGRGR